VAAWQLLAIVAAVGLTASLIRWITTHLFAVPSRRRGRGAPTRTARSVGIAEGETLVTWIDRGRSLPASIKRMVRVRASQGPVVRLLFHSDGPELEPLLHVEVGPIDRSTMTVRLVEVELRIARDGRLRVAARVRSTSTDLPIRVLSKGIPRVPTEVDDTRLL
jgi:hypothetical protein